MDLLTKQQSLLQKSDIFILAIWFEGHQWDI